MRMVVVIVQRKGGVGKTTVAINLAGEMSERGFGLLAIDADDQQSALQWAQPGGLTFPVHELPIKPGCARDWANALGHIHEELILIDTPPSDYAIGAAVAVADLVIVPCTPSGLDIETTAHALTVVNAVRERRTQDVPVLLVPNRVDLRSLEGQQLVAELEGFGEPVAPQLGDRSAFVRAFAAGQTVSTFAPGTASDREVKALCDEVMHSLRAPSLGMLARTSAQRLCSV
jgi:chromosome partitioning protein